MENLDALNQFLGDEKSEKKTEKQVENQEKKVIKQRDGLVERFDKVYVTNDGRQLLREQY